jgi:hypothetical protein
MPTLNPRINVTVSPSLDDLVRRLAGLQRCSKSQVLRELLEACEPQLGSAVALMEAASRAGPQVLAGLAASLDRSQQAAEDVLAGAVMRLGQAERDLVDQAEAVRGRRPRRTAERASGGASGAQNPPASNRGVKSGSTGKTTGPTRAPRTRRRG